MPDISPRPVAPTAADLERLHALAGSLLAIVREDGLIEHASSSWEHVLGYAAADLAGRSFLDLVHPEDIDATLSVMETNRHRGVSDFENRYRTNDGRWRRLRWRAEYSGGRWFCVAEDVTHRRQLERDVLRDPLTGALNRTAFFDRLAHALARAERGSRALAVLFLDLDGFKSVNDSLGHAVGDEVLCVVAQRIDAAIRRADTLARLGGDEFVVLAEDIGDGTTVEALLERIADALAEPLTAGEGTITLGASIGVVRATGGSAADVIREADVAMYRAKAQGRNRAVWFDDHLRSEVRERLALAADLRGALGRGELRVFYQPLVSITDEAVVGCEALLRWAHPRRGVLTPDAFLPIAEEDGDIVEIGTWVLDQACRRQRAWRLEGKDLSVSVNVSPRELADPRYAERVARVLEDTGVDPVSIVLEVTETALLRDTTNAARSLGALKRLGLRIALDDFGRGYSSLEHLRTLPVDVIKIDRGFVAEIGRSEDDRAIVGAVVALARATGLTVIAEGVEREEQLRELREVGCPLGQGHLFGLPAPPDELEVGGFLPRGLPGVGDPFVIREFMRQIGIPARIR